MKHCVVLGLFVVAAISTCVQQSPGLDFSVSPCDETIDAHEMDLGIKDVSWLDETTLVVTVYVAINCAEKIEDGDFKILGSTILLEYTAPQCEMCVFSLCVHRLVYKFTNLEKKDYQFKLRAIRPCTLDQNTP